MRSSMFLALSAIALAIGGPLGCSDSGNQTQGGSGGKGDVSLTGGAVTMGGTMATGGTKPTGGSSSGGTVSGGAVGSTSGGTVSGGAMATGGVKTGGNSTGGTTSGGKPAEGGGVAGGNSDAGSPETGSGGAATVTKFVGNITTSNSVDTGGLKFSKYWDQITPENAGKWGSVQSSATSAFNWTTLDAIYDYAKKNNLIFKQHAFVWGSQQPSGIPTQDQVKTWITEFCKRYPDTKLIDVVNEPPPHTTPNYVDNIGGGTNGDWKWIVNSFVWAREACPKAILILNDYNNIEYGGQTAHFIDIVLKAKAAGAPIDAVGAQAHDVPELSITNVKLLMDKINTETGLPMYITEYDVSVADDNGQLEVYKTQFPVFLNTSYVKGITIWGWIHGKTWYQAPESGLVKGTTFRPAMTWLMGQLNRPTTP